MEASTLETDENVIGRVGFCEPVFASFGTGEAVPGPGSCSSCGKSFGALCSSSCGGGAKGSQLHPRREKKQEGSDSRGLKAAKSAARRLLEDLAPGAREARDDGGTNGSDTTDATHAVQRAGRRAVGLLVSGAILGFRGAIQCGKECGKDEAVGPSNDTAGTASRSCTSSPDLISPPRVPAQVHRDRFQPYPPMWLCHFRLQWCTRLHGISAFCGKSDADGAKAGSHDGQMEAQGTPGSHRHRSRFPQGRRRRLPSRRQQWFLRPHRHLLRLRCRYLL